MRAGVAATREVDTYPLRSASPKHRRSVNPSGFDSGACAPSNQKDLMQYMQSRGGLCVMPVVTIRLDEPGNAVAPQEIRGGKNHPQIDLRGVNLGLLRRDIN